MNYLASTLSLSKRTASRSWSGAIGLGFVFAGASLPLIWCSPVEHKRFHKRHHQTRLYHDHILFHYILLIFIIFSLLLSLIYSVAYLLAVLNTYFIYCQYLLFLIYMFVCILYNF